MEDVIKFKIPSKADYIDIREKNANEFGFFEKPGPKTTQKNIYEVNVSGSVFDHEHPSWKSIISQIREVFCELHEKVERNEKFTKDLNTLCLEANKKYLDTIQNELKATEASDDNVIENFRLLYKIWKLCEIVFIKSSSTLAIDLQEWYKTTYNLDPVVQKLFEDRENPLDIFSHEDYWPTVIMSVLQGRIDTARHLLSFHGNKNSCVFRSVDELLRKMPNISNLNHLSTLEFKARWEYWQKECLNVFINSDFSIDKELEVICNILCAREKSFVDMKDYFNHWYYMLISYLFYSNPTFNISDLNAYLSTQKFMEHFELDTLDFLIFSIFDFDIETVVNSSVDILSNKLFTAHFLDILYLNGKLQLNKDPNYDSSTQLYEENLADYGCSLLASSHTWLIGCDYLIRCFRNINGIDFIEAFIEKMSFESENDALELFKNACKYDLQERAYSIGRVMEMRYLKISDYKSALNWCIKIKDPSFGTILAEKLINEFSTTRNYELLNLTEKLTNEMAFCDRLMFISKYNEFFKLMNANKYKEAGVLVVQLLEAPQMIPILNKSDVVLELFELHSKDVFSEEQIFSLLRTIQNLENETKTQMMFNGSENKKLSQLPWLQNSASDERLTRWNQILNGLNTQLAQRFVDKSIEMSLN